MIDNGLRQLWQSVHLDTAMNEVHGLCCADAVSELREEAWQQGSQLFQGLVIFFSPLHEALKSRRDIRSVRGSAFKYLKYSAGPAENGGVWVCLDGHNRSREDTNALQKFVLVQPRNSDELQRTHGMRRWHAGVATW